ncbi:hypothetical protein DIE03_22430 [Burkholderia sp. Bp8992]|uniref:non-ribosomal peptide synthetase n=1 Tax=Burkholderia sp. Bp8992 TaxID=2184554 RepID=UPI000F58C9C5|nr:non-ribosomal peptide synthetase [Burkholderia sp. Bp8992]RQS26599.1 hypothetical protein DIE03_22430 [Burkholderia sp. Bp8992]
MTDATIPGLLAQVFQREADREALWSAAGTLRYRELDILSATIAARLRRAGIGPGKVVGLDLPRSIRQVVFLVGIVRAGAAFCYLDSRHPDTWNRSIVERIGIRHLVSQATPGYARGITALAPDVLLQPLSDPVPPASPACSADDWLYVNFSSGTTGAPKIIPCTHRGVLNFCHDAPHLPPLGPGTRLAYSSPLTFDASQFEIWAALLNGGGLIVNDDSPVTAGLLSHWVRRASLTTLWLTTSLFNTLADVAPRCFNGIRDLIVGGEELSPRHVARIYAENASITIHNGYGPTENTIMTCVFQIPRDFSFPDKIPLGRPVRGHELRVLDASGAPCADGEIGELAMSGPGLSPGYIGDDALTHKRFRYLEIDGERVRHYLSGDMVSRDVAGLYHYHGRADDQLKIRGNRVALSDITLAYSSCEGLRECVALAVRGAGGAWIGLTYVPDGDDPGTAILAAFGNARLPAFMVPARFMAQDELPLRENGKLDVVLLRARFEALEREVRDAVTGDADTSLDVLRRLLRLPRLGIDDDYFDAGGDSLGAISIVSAINRLTGDDSFSVADFYATPTLSALSAYLQQAGVVVEARASEPGAEPGEYHVFKIS